MSRTSIEDIEKEIDKILSEAKEKKMKIIGDARRKAEEILSKPFPTSTYELEAEKIIDAFLDYAEREDLLPKNVERSTILRKIF